MFNRILTGIFGSRNERLIKQMQKSVARINALMGNSGCRMRLKDGSSVSPSALVAIFPSPDPLSPIVKYRSLKINIRDEVGNSMSACWRVPSSPEETGFRRNTTNEHRRPDARETLGFARGGVARPRRR